MSYYNNVKTLCLFSDVYYYFTATLYLIVWELFQMFLLLVLVSLSITAVLPFICYIRYVVR